MTPTILELYMVWLDPQTYPDATLEVTIGAGDSEVTQAMCRDHLDVQRRMLLKFGGRGKHRYTTTELFLLAMSENHAPATPLALHHHGEAKCAYCITEKQGRMPR